MQLSGLPGSGPGPHIDPWRESFYVLEGELTFRFEQDGVVESVVGGAGDAVSIPAGVGHAFVVSSPEPACYLILGTPAGIDTFFADAGEPQERPQLPQTPSAFDRERLLAAFARHELSTSYNFPGQER
ncbi:MAG TPA: cupin domain-containing protein [Solirubrobacteraceae bacterium]|jgi:quercetin dioxygenase-like cupin family protein